jgi:hypothetical protein
MEPLLFVTPEDVDRVERDRFEFARWGPRNSAPPFPYPHPLPRSSRVPRDTGVL